MPNQPILNRAHPLNRGRVLWLRADYGVDGPSWGDLVRNQEAILTGASGGANQGIISGHRDGGRSLLSNNGTIGSGANLTGLNPIPYTQENFTIALWVYFRSNSGTRNSVMLRGSGAGGQMGILVNGPAPGSSIWRFQNGTSAVNSGILANLTWYRLLVSASPSGIRMFRNGVLETTGSAQSSASYPFFSTWTLGYDPNSSRVIDGLIDSVSLWDYAIPDSLAWDDYVEELTGCRKTLLLPDRREVVMQSPPSSPVAAPPWLLENDMSGGFLTMGM